MDQRINKFINESKNVCNSNSDTIPYIQNSICELTRYWNDVKRQANEMRTRIEDTLKYFLVNDQVSLYYLFV